MVPTLALKDKTIIVTRAKEQATSFSKKIAALGGIPIEIPLIDIQPVNHLTFSTNDFSTYQWIIFSSVNGVRYFFHFLEKYNLVQSFQTSHAKIAAVGSKTMQELEKNGVKVDFIPSIFTGKCLADEIIKFLNPGDQVLFVRGNIASDTIPKQLTENQINVESITTYETVRLYENSEGLLRYMKEHTVDIITFASPSTVQVFATLFDNKEYEDLINNVTLASIGPITEAEFQKYGRKSDIVATELTIDGLISKIIHYFEEKKG